jgi:hypothetical protein
VFPRRAKELASGRPLLFAFTEADHGLPPGDACHDEKKAEKAPSLHGDRFGRHGWSGFEALVR